MKIMNKTVPWWMIICAKIVLCRLPISYSFFKKIRLMEHGDMNLPHRAYENLLKHAKAAGVLDETATPPKLLKTDGDFNLIEFGPGDSLFTMMVAKALGANRTWLIDVQPFATTDLAKYGQVLDFLKQKGYSLPFAQIPDSFDGLLKQCNGDYLLQGVQSLSQIPSGSVDFCFSQTVLQHIPKNEFNTMVSEVFRVLKPKGVSHHRIDLKDLLEGHLNHLRVPDFLWESNLFRNSGGFYSNRIRFNEMVKMFEQSFKCTILRIIRWEQLPTPRAKMNPEFRRLPDDDLLVSDFDILLQKT